MPHLEDLLCEYYDWQGFLVKRNAKVGRRPKGGWEGELDVMAYHPKESRLVHIEASLDALTWEKRELRFKRKFETAARYIFSEVFTWLPPDTPFEQVAVLPNHPVGRDTIGGGKLVSIDEKMAEIRARVMGCGLMAKNAVPEQYPLLRTVQLTHSGYYGAKVYDQ